jgi:ABC-type sugar transport system ATPase subunit
MLEVRNISKNFGGVQALKNVSVQFFNGEIHGLVGGNGAGKSTLMKIVSGVYSPDKGHIELDGATVAFHRPIEAYDAGIRIVHQELSLIRSLTIAENVLIHKFRGGSFVRFVNRRKSVSEAKKVLEEWDIPVNPSTKVSRVSMGVRQLIEIARELSTGGKIIILDEPTSSLTPREMEHLFRFLRSLRDKGFVVIFISHRLNEVTDLADRITVLRDGALVATGETRNTDAGQICSLIAGKDMSELFPKTESRIGDLALQARNLSGEGFSNISFDVRWGEIVGIAGLMGAGRSELMRAIFGLDRQATGALYLDGAEVRIQSPANAIQKGLVMLSENRSEEGIFPDLSVSKNLIILKLKRFVKGLFLDRKKMTEEVDSLVTSLNISSYKPESQTVSELSGGNQQKVVLGRLLGSNPKILILDEPTRGVDVGSKTEIHKIMGEFVKNGGAIIMVSSEIDELIGISDRIVILYQGNSLNIIERSGFQREGILRCMMNVPVTP